MQALCSHVTHFCMRLMESGLYRRISTVIVAISWYNALHSAVLEHVMPFTPEAFVALGVIVVALYITAVLLNLWGLRCTHTAAGRALGSFITECFGHMTGWALRGLVQQAVLRMWQRAPGHMIWLAPVLTYSGLLASFALHIALRWLMGRRHGSDFDERLSDVEADAFGLTLGWLAFDWTMGWFVGDYTRNEAYLELFDHASNEEASHESGHGSGAAEEVESIWPEKWLLESLLIAVVILSAVATKFSNALEPTPREALEQACSEEALRQMRGSHRGATAGAAAAEARASDVDTEAEATPAQATSEATGEKGFHELVWQRAWQLVWAMALLELAEQLLLKSALERYVPYAGPVLFACLFTVLCTMATLWAEAQVRGREACVVTRRFSTLFECVEWLCKRQGTAWDGKAATLNLTGGFGWCVDGWREGGEAFPSGRCRSIEEHGSFPTWNQLPQSRVSHSEPTTWRRNSSQFAVRQAMKDATPGSVVVRYAHKWHVTQWVLWWCCGNPTLYVVHEWQQAD